MPIPQFKMNTNDPSTWGEIEGTQEQTKRRLVVFKGRTTDTTPTVLFLDGVSNYRLKVHDTGVMNVLWEGASLGPAAATSSAATGEVSIGNFAGTTALVGAAVVRVRGAADTYAFTADDTNDALTLTVTAATAVTRDWEVQCWVAEVSSDAGQTGV